MKIMKILQIQTDYQKHKARLKHIKSLDLKKKVSTSVYKNINKINGYKNKKSQSQYFHEYQKQRQISIKNEKLHRILQNVYSKDSTQKVYKQVNQHKQDMFYRTNSQNSIRSHTSWKITEENYKINKKINLAKSTYRKFRQKKNSGEHVNERGTAESRHKQQVIRLLQHQLGYKPKVVFPNLKSKSLNTHGHVNSDKRGANYQNNLMTKNRIYSNVNSSVSNISSKHDKIKIVNGGRQSINWNGMYKQRVKTNNDDDVDGHNEGYSSDFNSKSNSKSIHSICMQKTKLKYTTKYAPKHPHGNNHNSHDNSNLQTIDKPIERPLHQSHIHYNSNRAAQGRQSKANSKQDQYKQQFQSMADNSYGNEQFQQSRQSGFNSQMKSQSTSKLNDIKIGIGQNSSRRKESKTGANDSLAPR